MTSNAATNIVVITIAQALPLTNSSSPNFKKTLNKVASIPAKYKISNYTMLKQCCMNVNETLLLHIVLTLCKLGDFSQRFCSLIFKNSFRNIISLKQFGTQIRTN